MVHSHQETNNLIQNIHTLIKQKSNSIKIRKLANSEKKCHIALDFVFINLHDNVLEREGKTYMDDLGIVLGYLNE